MQKKNKKGFSTIEMVLALLIISISLTATVGLVFGGQSLSIGTNINNESLYLGQKQMENVRATSRNDFGALVEGTTNDTSNVGYKIDRIVENIDDYTKQVTVVVNWLLGGTHQLPVSLSTIVSNPPSFFAGDTCQTPLATDWSSPKVLNTGKIDVGSGNTATSIAVSKINDKLYAFITASGGGSHSNFFVVDVSTDIKNPTIVGQVPFGTFSQPELDSVFISGNYAYVAGYNHGGGFNDQGGTVSVQDGYAHVGTNKGKLTQFGIIDVNQPSSPIVLNNSKMLLPINYSYFVIDATQIPSVAPTIAFKDGLVSEQINLIQINNKKAYVSTEGYEGSTEEIPDGEGFLIYDVSTLTSPIPKGAFDSGAHGYGMYTKDPAHILLGSGGNGELFTLMQNSSNDITKIDPFPISIGKRISGLMLSGSYIFLAAQDATKTFQVLDGTDLSNLTAPIASLDFSGTGSGKGAPAGGMDCQNNTFYMVTDSQNDALKIIIPGPTANIVDQKGTDQTGSTTLPLGSTVHIEVQDSKGIFNGGTVDFNRYTNNTCTIGAVSMGNNIPMTAGARSQANLDYTPIAAATTYYKVHYDSDSTYSPCMTVTFVKSTPTINLEIHDNTNEAVGTSFLPNTKVHAKATLSNNGINVPTGNIGFSFYPSSTNCTSNGITAVNQALDTSGVAHPSIVSSPLILGGSYSFKANYASDVNYNSVSKCQQVFAKMQPSITTTSPQSTINAGASTTDTAALVGASSTAGGTVTYNAYSDAFCQTLVNSGGSKTVTNGAVPLSNAVTFNLAGQYYWQAVYSGDAKNQGATSVCGSDILNVGQAVTSVTNTISPSTITVGNSAKDTATINGDTVTSSGTVTYNVYSDSSCSILYQSAGTSNVANGVVANSSNLITFNTVGTYYWQASYSGDVNNLGSKSACNSIIITPFNVTHGAVTITSKNVTVSLTNNSSSSTYISKITISWPHSNGQLNTIQIQNPNKNIFTTNTNPTSLTTSTFVGTQADRTFNSGSTRNFVLQFQNNAAPSGYTISIEFDGNPANVVNIP